MLPKKFLEKYPEFKDEKIKLFYVRDDNKNQMGVIIIYGYKIGWSLCNSKDKWDKIIGIRKALYKSKPYSINEWIEIIKEKRRNINWKNRGTKYYNHLVELIRKLKEIENIIISKNEKEIGLNK